jgi:hypothetical protein
MRWLTGFLAFGLAYAAFVIGIYWTNAPTLANPDLFRTLESELPGAQQRSINKVRSDRREVTSDARFEIRQSDNTTSVITRNGHVILLNPETTERQAQAIGEQYVRLVEAHAARLALREKNQMVIVIMLPLILLSIFVYFARWLWKQLSVLE